MMSTFSFGFSGDDIDIDDPTINDLDERNTFSPQEASTMLPELVEAKKHSLGEWVSTLPSQISYNTLTLSQNQDTETMRNPLTIARREVFDIRAQLMAEDSADEENGELIAGLEKGDIKPNFYEGGFKTWECSLDLAKLVSKEPEALPESNISEGRHVIELGAGTAVPSLAIFAQLLSRAESGEQPQKTHFTFADYNSAVLRLVTLPNLLLTWNYAIRHRNTAPSSSVPSDGISEEKEDEELDITPELVENFQSDLAKKGITITFISGAWSPSFVDLVLSSEECRKCKTTTILASETIYSPASLSAFSETLLALLRLSVTEGRHSKAFIAAKKVYFGVGGGVDEFLSVLYGISGDSLDLKERVDIKSEGVGRIVLEIGVRQ